MNQKNNDLIMCGYRETHQIKTHKMSESPSTPCSAACTWPAKDVIATLVESTNILLDRYDYDGHGYEVICAARDEAVKFLER